MFLASRWAFRRLAKVRPLTACGTASLVCSFFRLSASRRSQCSAPKRDFKLEKASHAHINSTS